MCSFVFINDKLKTFHAELCALMIDKANAIDLQRVSEWNLTTLSQQQALQVQHRIHLVV